MATTPTTLPEFIAALKDNADAALVFAVNGNRIRGGYHITELNHAAVQSVDCGGNQDGWDETVIQLLDGHSDEGHMTAGKFSLIAQKSLGAIPALALGRLRFEYAPQNGPAQVFTAGQLSPGKNDVTVELNPEFTACKPTQTTLGCCGANANTTQSSGCCAG